VRKWSKAAGLKFRAFSGTTPATRLSAPGQRQSTSAAWGTAAFRGWQREGQKKEEEVFGEPGKKNPGKNSHFQTGGFPPVSDRP
jgi:hypothetical protein